MKMSRVTMYGRDEQNNITAQAVDIDCGFIELPDDTIFVINPGEVNDEMKAEVARLEKEGKKVSYLNKPAK